MDELPVEVPIATEQDIVSARQVARKLAADLGLGMTDVTRVVTAASELARNAFVHAGGGVMRWQRLNSNGRTGLELVFLDEGPGIADLEEATTPGFTTGRGLGLGLSGTQRLMDELEFAARPGGGTVVTTRKWRR